MEHRLLPGIPDEIGQECIFRDWKAEVEPPEFLLLSKAAGYSQPIVVMAPARVNMNLDARNPKYHTLPDYRLSLFEPKTASWAELPLMISGIRNGLPRFCQLNGVGSDLVVMGGWDPNTREVSNVV
ncbi:unnamed protein product [Prunus armeniaca]|uniref:Uncharacterized protein n=1 Tax=Prunus armeniaca TaxID=36596 RepID=A0A6J5U8X7_PRUAR|nr:unnamed protein product [Prunus armeniaca]